VHGRASELPTNRSGSAHDVDLLTALAFGRAAGASLPDDDNVWVVGVVAADLIHFGEECTADVARAIPRAVDQVIELLNLSTEGDP
jgi:Ni,Fe-hydrogenase maturation factor